MAEKSHFKGKGVLEHLFEARKKGHKATEESHGIEAPGHIVGGADSAKEAATVSLLIWMIATSLSMDQQKIYILLALFLFGFFLWKIGRGAVLAWSRLERVNRLIEDEKYEIEHNREEEKQELTEMYKAKGFSGELLEKVIDVLMADDNKLLGVMLEEELVVSLESYEHPLKQALGSGIGVFLATCALSIGVVTSQSIGLYFATFIIVSLSSYIIALIEKLNILHAIVWNLAITFPRGPDVSVPKQMPCENPSARDLGPGTDHSYLSLQCF